MRLTPFAVQAQSHRKGKQGHWERDGLRIFGQHDLCGHLSVPVLFGCSCVLTYFNPFVWPLVMAVWLNRIHKCGHLADLPLVASWPSQRRWGSFAQRPARDSPQSPHCYRRLPKRLAVMALVLRNPMFSCSSSCCLLAFTHSLSVSSPLWPLLEIPSGRDWQEGSVT